MSTQMGTGLRNALANTTETHIGASPVLQIWRGTMPANCAAADAGTKIWEATLPSDWLAAASGGQKVLAGSWTANAVAANPATVGGATGPLYWRLKTSGGVCEWQGAVTQTGGEALAGCTTTAGSASVTAPANTIPNLALVSGTGIPAGAYVQSGGGTTALTLSTPATAGGTVSLTFTGTMTLQNVNLVVGQAVNVTDWTITVPHA